jgi:fumarate reductase iron-sulfur subunit
MNRRLTFEVFRYNPEDPDSVPHIDQFELEESPYMTLYIALNRIREEQDPGLQFDFACRSAICGSCGRPFCGYRHVVSADGRTHRSLGTSATAI